MTKVRISFIQNDANLIHIFDFIKQIIFETNLLLETYITDYQIFYALMVFISFRNLVLALFSVYDGQVLEGSLVSRLQPAGPKQEPFRFGPFPLL